MFFSLKVSWEGLVFCLLKGLVCVMDEFSTLGVSLISMLWEISNNCTNIFLIFTWMCPYCGNCCGQFVTLYVILQVTNVHHWVEAMVPLFHNVLKDNMVPNILAHIPFPVPCLLLCCFSHWCCLIYTIWAYPPGVYGIKCPSAVLLEAVLLVIWMQVYIFADLIKYAIDWSVAYLIFCCTLLDWTDVMFQMKFILVWRQTWHPCDHLIISGHIPRVVTISLGYYCPPSDVCKVCAHDTMTHSMLSMLMFKWCY